MEGKNCLVSEMRKYVGQTVTIFTNSGGESGYGFTGVLIDVDNNCVSLLNHVGAAPACPVGSSCGGNNRSGCGCGSNNGSGYGSSYGSDYSSNYNSGSGCGCGRNNGNPFGAVTEIPVCSIASFTHNAI